MLCTQAILLNTEKVYIGLFLNVHTFPVNTENFLQESLENLFEEFFKIQLSILNKKIRHVITSFHCIKSSLSSFSSASKIFNISLRNR